MKAFILTIVLLLVVAIGASATAKPGEVRREPGAGWLLAIFLARVALAAWGLSLII